MNDPIIIKLWENINPRTDNGISEPEIEENGIVTNVSVPELYVYLPKKNINKKAAIIICPGGGYGKISLENEGYLFAQWLQAEGITGIVLKYRMPNKHKDVLLEDFEQAIHCLNSKITEWDISADKIGVAGFSAGGHLASMASTLFSKGNIRLSFSLLFYPVITMGELTHAGSRSNFMGENPTTDDILSYSSEKRVDKSTPPAILLLSDDDPAVSPQNSLMYYNALKENNIPASIHIFPVGGHGWGMKKDFAYHNQMLTLVRMWLEKIF